MPNLNCVHLIGHLTRNPDLRYTGAGTPVCEIGLAVNRGYGDKQEVYYAGVIVWGKAAEFIASRVEKGSCVYIQGFLRCEEFEDRHGVKQSKTKVVADSIQLLEKSAPAVSSPTPPPMPPLPPPYEPPQPEPEFPF